jgi:hypothetical protein
MSMDEHRVALIRAARSVSSGTGWRRVTCTAVSDSPPIRPARYPPFAVPGDPQNRPSTRIVPAYPLPLANTPTPPPCVFRARGFTRWAPGWRRPRQVPVRIDSRPAGFRPE